VQINVIWDLKPFLLINFVQKEESNISITGFSTTQVYYSVNRAKLRCAKLRSLRKKEQEISRLSEMKIIRIKWINMII